MTLNFSPLVTGLSMFSTFRSSLFRLKEPMLLKRMLHWYVDTLWRSNVCTCLSHRLWEDTSTMIKPYFCVGVTGGGTVHLFPVQLKLLCCSVFSNSRIDNSLRYRWKPVTLSHRRPLFVIFNWFPCLVGCSVRSSGGLCVARARN